MKNWTPEQVARWGKIRTKGRTRYLLTRGFGLAFLYYFGAALGKYAAGIGPSAFYGVTSVRGFIIMFVFLYPIGLMYAWMAWWRLENSYREEIENASGQPDEAFAEVKGMTRNAVPVNSPNRPLK